MNNKIKKDRSLDTLTVPLYKADDWTRRRFIQNVGIFMTAFGASWSLQMDVMSRISRKILGGSLAFAQSTQLEPFYVHIGCRSGLDLSNIFCYEADSTTLSPGRAFFELPNDPLVPQTVQIHQLTNGRRIYAPSVMNDFASKYKDWIVSVDGGVNNSGHMAEHQTSWIQGSSSAGICAAAAYNFTKTNPLVLSNPIAFAEENTVNVSRVGALGPAYAPNYLRSQTELQGFFEVFKITDADGGILPESTTKEILKTIRDTDEAVLNELKVADRPGGTLINASLDQVHTLLVTDYSQKVAVNQTEINRMGDNGAGAQITIPNSLRSTGDVRALLASIVKLFENKVAPVGVIQFSTGDHHQNGRGQGANAGVARDIDVALNRLLVNFWDVLASKPDPFNPSGTLADRTVMQIHTEFTRSVDGVDPANVGTSLNWNDGVKSGFVTIASPQRINGGQFGGRDADNKVVPFDPATGNLNPGGARPTSTMLAKTCFRMVMSKEVAEQAGVTNADDVISAALV